MEKYRPIQAIYLSVFVGAWTLISTWDGITHLLLVNTTLVINMELLNHSIISHRLTMNRHEEKKGVLFKDKKIVYLTELKNDRQI